MIGMRESAMVVVDEGGARRLKETSTIVRWILTLMLVAGAILFQPVPSHANTTDSGSNDVYWNVPAPENLELPEAQQVYAVASAADLENLLRCLDRPNPASNNVDCSESGAVGVCMNGWCSGHFSGVTTTFALHTVAQNWIQWEAECRPLMETTQPVGGDTFTAGRDCSIRVGCQVDSDPSGATLSVYCPFFASAPLGELIVESESSDGAGAITSLPILGPPEKVVRDLALSAGTAVVLGVLALLPTQLINSTLSANAWVLDRFRRKPKKEGAELQGKQGNTRRVVTAIGAFLLASALVGFVDPDFGTTWQSLEVVALAFGAFVLVNLVGTVMVWLLFRRKSLLDVPSIEVNWGYLVVIAVTVLMSRILGLDPVIVFGAILAIETGKILVKQKREVQKLAGQMEQSAGLSLMTLGFAAWAGYQALELTGVSEPTAIAALKAFLSVVTVETLATLPILLLPLAFLPGSVIFAWSKWRWGVVYLLGLTLFVFVLIPLPDSWSETGQTLGSWSLAIVAYGLFSVVIWAAFAALGSRREAQQSQAGRTPADDKLPD
jgi:hypothetical protein